MKLVTVLVIVVAAMLATTDAQSKITPVRKSVPTSEGAAQVGSDPNARSGFEVYRPRSGRALRTEVDEAKAAREQFVVIKKDKVNSDSGGGTASISSAVRAGVAEAHSDEAPAVDAPPS